MIISTDQSGIQEELPDAAEEKVVLHAYLILAWLSCLTCVELKSDHIEVNWY